MIPANLIVMPAGSAGGSPASFQLCLARTSRPRSF
jgi:hypothetical protein